MAGSESEDQRAFLAEDLYTLVSYLHRSCNADLLDAIDEAQLTATQVRFLHRLHEVGECPTIKVAAGMAGIHHTPMSKVVSELHDRRLVERLEDENDSRRKRVRIAPAGEVALERLSAVRMEYIESLCASLNEAQCEQLLEALGPVISRPAVMACRPQ